MRNAERMQWLLSLFVFLFWFGNLKAPCADTYLYNQAGIGVGSRPAGITLGDFNGDGRLDIAVVNAGSNTVSIILGKSNGSFAQKVDYTVGAAPAALITADFNGDHILDLAVVNEQDSTVSILLGVGNGTFKSQVTYSAGTSPLALVTGDFNDDSKSDLAIANQGSGTVSILLGRGDGTFQAQFTVTTVSSPISISVGDFNNDRRPDLVSINTQGDVSLLLNTGTGGFTASEFSIGFSAGGLAVGDFNNDGNLDIVATNPVSDELLTLLGNGSGGFQTISTLMTVSPVSVTVGDFNHDGKLDLAIGAGGGYPSTIAILLGYGNGTYHNPLNVGFSGTALPMAVGDFNNDSRLDLAAVDNSNNQVTILLGSGNGKIGGHVDLTLPASGGIAGTAAADFIEGGSLDVGIAQFDQNGNVIKGLIAVLPGNGNGTFKPAVSTRMSNIGIGDMVAGDFNGDGKIDIATASVPTTGDISVVLGNGDGTFGSPETSPVTISLNVQKMIGGDFNNDGRADLALLALDSSNTFSPLYVLLSNGDGTFQPKLVENVPGIATSVAIGDLNHDGILDLVVTDPHGGVNPSLLVFLGQGNGSFKSPASYKTGTLFTNDVMVADFNQDGHLDLAVGTEQGIFFFAGNGDGTFKAPVKTPMPVSIGHMAVGDFNGDGKPDLAFSGVAQGMDVAIGNGNGTFQAPIEFQPTYYPRTAQLPVGDFNGDGVSDLMQFSSKNTLSVSTQTATVWSSTPTSACSASKIIFGPEKVGTASSPQPIVFSNVGNAPLLISKIATIGEFTETNNCPASLGVGEECTIDVTFKPSTKGLANGKLTLTDNAVGNSQVVSFSGSGT